MAVESTETVEDDGIAVPDSEHGTVRVVKTSMVVTGTEAAVTTGPEGAMLEAQVTMAGLEPTWGAQMPWK